MRTALKAPVRRAILPGVVFLMLQLPGLAFSYDGATFNSLFDKGKIKEAMDLIPAQPRRPIDSWRLARGYAALGECSTALDLLNDAEQEAGWKINFLKRPEDFGKLRELCIESVDDGAAPIVKHNEIVPVSTPKIVIPAQTIESKPVWNSTIFGLIVLFFAASGFVFKSLRKPSSRPDFKFADAIVEPKRIEEETAPPAAQTDNPAWSALTNAHARLPVLVETNFETAKTQCKNRRGVCADSLAQFSSADFLKKLEGRALPTRTLTVIASGPAKSKGVSEPFDITRLAGIAALKLLEK